MLKILHFADAHIDMTNYGRHDPQSGLPVRVTDFLKSLDTIIQAAIDERVDLVLFAGDTYKDRNPAPTFQREWGKRIMRLSRAGIPCLLLVGNHDLSPALNRAHALESFDTLEVPNVRVLDRPTFLRPADLGDLPVQVIALPWISRSGLLAALQSSDETGSELDADVYEGLVNRLNELVQAWLEKADADIPIILTAHCSVQGASFGGERTVMLGNDLVLPASLVRDPRLDYVALGHIHKPQDLNQNPSDPLGHNHPPVIYPGSIERVDFGEAADKKFFVIAHVTRGRTEVEWRELTGIRPFVDRFLRLEQSEGITQQMIDCLPAAGDLKGVIARLVIEYPREWEALIDETALRQHTRDCLEFNLVKRPQMQARIRIPNDQSVGSLTPLELLDLYWSASHTDPQDVEGLNQLAAEMMREVHGDEEVD